MNGREAQYNSRVRKIKNNQHSSSKLRNVFASETNIMGSDKNKSRKSKIPNENWVGNNIKNEDGECF